MHRRWFPMFLTLLVVAAFLYLGGSAIYQNGWQQGFLMGQLVDGGNNAALPLALAGTHGGFGSGIGFLGSCLFFGFLLVLGGMAFKFFGMRRWAMAGSPPGFSDEDKQAHMERWAAHWQGRCGPRQPQQTAGDTAATPTPHTTSTPSHAADEITDIEVNDG